jgi:Leucine-rich repeat (LRR) protein
MLKRDRKKRTVCHGKDTIDFGYKGLRDAPLEYEIYPIIQEILHEGMVTHLTRLYLNDCRLTKLPNSIKELKHIQVLCLDSNYFR